MISSSQLQRTAGTIYGEIMKDSGVTFARGTYVTGLDFISALASNGVRIPGSSHNKLENLADSILYGDKDNVWTGVQLIGRLGNGTSPHNQYTFNPWKELMGDKRVYLYGRFDGIHLADIPQQVAEAFRRVPSNPRECVAVIRNIYAIFTELPQELQEEFLRFVEGHPCDLELVVAPKTSISYTAAHPLRLKVHPTVSKIIQATGEEHRSEIKYVLQLIAEHNICVGKPSLIRKQIEDLLGYDIGTIPERWQKGRITPAAVAEKREELTGLLDN